MAQRVLWRFNSQVSKKLDQLIKVIETENTNSMTNKFPNLTNKEYLCLISSRICNIENSTTQIVSIATKENPAGVKFHEYVRSDNLSSIYADYLERYQNLPQYLAMKRARFEVVAFGQDAVIEKINSDYGNGVRKQRKKHVFSEFFSSGIIEKDIERRLEEGTIPYELFAPLYNLIVKQDYSGEKDFAADLTTYTVKTYDELVNRAAIILRLEQLGVLLRISGKIWGDVLRFRLKSTDTWALKNLIYAGGSSHDHDYFEEQFNEGQLPRIFDARHIGLIF